MALTRYQIRNEYGLADKEFNLVANKDEDPDVLLETTSTAGLLGFLRQLGDLAEFAAEVLHCVQQELMKTASRGHGLTMRLQQLETVFPLIEIPILSQTDHSTFYYDPGLEWHCNLQSKEQLISSHNLPHCMMDYYEECRVPPHLFLLDKFDVVGSGSCLKRYSDPSLLKTLRALPPSKLSKYDRPHNSKKKGSHTTSKETPGDSRTSYAKLQQLLFLEHVDKRDINPEFHVILKRRQLNGLPINSSSGTSYLKNFLNGNLDHSSQVTVCNVQEDLPIPSLVYPNSKGIKKYNEMEMKSIADDDDEKLEIPFVPHQINDTYAAPISQINDTYDKSDCKLGFSQICTNAEVTQTEEDLPQFSNIGNESLAADAQDDVVPKTTSLDGSSRNSEQSRDISTCDINSENGTLMSDTPRDLHIGYVNFSASSCQENALANPNIPEISSYSGQECPQTTYVDGSESEVPIFDTQRHGTYFAGDQQTGMNNKASETKHKTELENIRNTRVSLLVEYCTHTPEEGQESSSDTELVNEEDCLDVSLHENPQADLEIIPPLPPLPPTQWWMGKLIESTEMPSLSSNGNNNFYIQRDEQTQNGTEIQYPSEMPVTDGVNHSSHVYAEASIEEADWRVEAKALEWFSQNLKEHSNTSHPKEPHEETEFAEIIQDNNSYDQNQKAKKPKRDDDSHVIGINRSMLRKVSEQSKSQVGARVDQNDSLLQIIRRQSFNLRPADASVMVRPNFQVTVPKVNLKVVAILEKANTLRQAMAGSDKEDDSESWSE